MNRLPRREIARQLPPLAACLHHIQHRVHHPAPFMLARSAAGVTPCTWFVQQRLQPHPLLVGQIARVHAPTLSTQTLSAYSFQGSFASFWTGSKRGFPYASCRTSCARRRARRSALRSTAAFALSMRLRRLLAGSTSLRATMTARTTMIARASTTITDGFFKSSQSMNRHAPAARIVRASIAAAFRLRRTIQRPPLRLTFQWARLENPFHRADLYTFSTSSAMFARLLCPVAAVSISALIAASTWGRMLL